jgi:FKBP-type peptidyl-prolyl cis-trans isomerase FkpA
MKKTSIAAKFVLLSAAVTITTVAFAADMNEDQKVLYAIGQALGQRLTPFSLTPAELEFVKQGIADSVAGRKPAVDMGTYGPKIQALAQSRHSALSGKAAAAGKAFADEAAKEKGAVRTPTGLVYIPLKEGSGSSPAASDKVRVNYRGTLVDGQEFDSSYKRGQPAEFPLGGVIKCWTEGVQRMKVGGKARLVCPADIAYGDNSPPIIPPGSTLNFEVELMAIVKP